MPKSQRVAPKRQAKSPAVNPVENPPQIPADLRDKWGAVEAVATTANLLQQGLFKHSFMNALNASIGFCIKLHETMVEDALKHPEASLIPQLKEELEARANGSKTKEN